MKKGFVILVLASICFFCSCLLQKKSKQELYNLQQHPDDSYKIDSVVIFAAYDPSGQGNADSGYQYLLHGDLINSGFPYSLYKFIFKTKIREALTLAGYNKYELNDFTIFDNGQIMAVPGCLQCHSQSFDGKLVIGLGNSYSKFQVNYSKYLKPARFFIKMLYGKNSTQWKNLENIYNAATVVATRIILEMQGPNPGHRIVDVMASHRDPLTLLFRADTSYFQLSPSVVPTDIPALWLAKKKNAWNYDGLAQPDPVKQFMLATLLTMKDTTEAVRIYSKMKDVWAYLKTLKPPKYPYSINMQLAGEGKQLFNSNCSGCHGTYGKDGYYPNKLIPEEMVGTDSMLLKYHSVYNGYEDWYNKSWFATAHKHSSARPEYGYIAQPLDGIWITAPYFHNGSVPTIEGVLNSTIRPRYWKRNFNRQEYDYEKVGWKYKKIRNPSDRKTYNTDIPGYGNYGHYYGDKLTGAERKAVIEYLKTL
ncbi:MAG: c-type cytochrome [Chitinophagales bacterium]